MNIGYLFSLFPLFGYGVSDYSASRLSKNVHPTVVAFLYSLLSIVPISVIGLLYGLPIFSLESITIFLLAAIITNFGFILLVKAFSKGKTGVVAPIVNSYTIVTLLVLVLFQDESILPVQILATIVVVAGIGLLSYQNKGSKRSKSSIESIVLAVASMILFGIGFVIFDIAATQQWYQNVILFELTNIIITFLIMLVWLRFRWFSVVKEAIYDKFIYLGVLFGSAGNIGLFIAIANVDNVGIPAAIGAASPVVTAGLAKKYDKESLTLMQSIGMFIVIVGVVMLSLA